MGLGARILNRSRDLVFGPLTDRRYRRDLAGSVTCLLYHRVCDPDPFTFLSPAVPVITPRELELELSFLRSLGVIFTTFRALRDGWFPAPDEAAFIISFDDGFLDNYTQGLEVLDRLGVPAVFFQSTAMLAPGPLIWEHQLYWLARGPVEAASLTRLTRQVLADRPGIDSLSGASLVEHLREQVPARGVQALLAAARPKLTTQDELEALGARLYPEPQHLRRARSAGHEIGSHGHHHFKRATIERAAFEEELGRSRDRLTEVLGEPPEAFSYPFSSYLPGDREVCGAYFAQAVTVDKARIRPGCDPLSLPRFTWPGSTSNPLRRRRWLLTGTI